MPGILLNIEEQFFRDYLKVKMRELAAPGRRGRIAVNPLPVGQDTDYEQWRPGDTVIDRDAAAMNRPAPLWTIAKIEDNRVYFDVGSGKLDMTRVVNLARLQERKA